MNQVPQLIRSRCPGVRSGRPVRGPLCFPRRDQWNEPRFRASTGDRDMWWPRTAMLSAAARGKTAPATPVLRMHFYVKFNSNDAGRTKKKRKFEKS